MLKSLLDPCSIIRVQAWKCELPTPSVVGQMLDIVWPTATGAVASSCYIDILCTEPTDWLIVSTDSDFDFEPLLEQFSGAYMRSAYRATNVSSALRRIQVDGSRTRALLSKGRGLDVHPEMFAPRRLRTYAICRHAGDRSLHRRIHLPMYRRGELRRLSGLVDAVLAFSGTFA